MATPITPQSTPLAPEAAEGDAPAAAPIAPSGNDVLICDIETENEPPCDELAKPPNPIVKQLHQLTALSLLQSSHPVNYSKNFVNRTYNFQKVCVKLYIY